MRELVTIRTIDNIREIPGCDSIELAIVGGWQCIVKKGLHSPGERIVYIEVDSFLPEGNPYWDEIVKRSHTSVGGKSGHKLRTIKMRGCVSQGLVLPLDCLLSNDTEGTIFDKETGKCLIEDLAKHLNIYLFPQPDDNKSGAKGNFPTHLFPKTDQERFQNMDKEVLLSHLNSHHVVTEKLDGSSMSVFFDVESGEYGVCSRNLQLQTDGSANLYVNVARAYELERKLKNLGKSVVVQGELVGPKVQGNKYKLENCQFFVYAARDLRSPNYYNFEELQKFCAALSLTHVPVVEGPVISDITIENVYEKLLQFADKNSTLNNKTICEGFVFWGNDFSFKVINNNFLLKE